MKDKMGKELSSQEVLIKVQNRLVSYLLDLELMLLRWTGYVPFHHFRRFIYRLAGMKIGKGSTIHMFANFYNPANITIGQDSIIGDHVFIDGRDKVEIGNHVDIASEVKIYNSQHDIDSEDFHAIEKPVKIEDYTFIGPRVTILPNTVIGKGAVVGAAALITKNVPELTLVGGVPAKEIRKRNIKKLDYKIGRARWFQ
jgi:acetyltransferase-like isoleucine patch superfamily enzyme